MQSYFTSTEIIKCFKKSKRILSLNIVMKFVWLLLKLPQGLPTFFMFKILG